MKRRLLSMVLSMAMVFTMLPAASLQAQDSVPAGTVNKLITSEDGTMENLARNAEATAAHTNTYGISTTKINDGTLAGSDATTSWNCWGAASNLYPMPVTLTWDTAQTMSSMRIMWWAYHDGGVGFPSGAELKYKDGEEWKSVNADIGLEHGGVDGVDGVWNVVNFDSPITTTALRLLVDREEGAGYGIGISEWEVFSSKLRENIVGANISGKIKLLKDDTETYTGSVLPERLGEGAAYEWSVPSASQSLIEIQGDTDKSQVSVKALAEGSAKLHLKVTKDNVTKETDFTINVSDETVTSVDKYKTSTAAGVAPILPDSVVANGPEFDEATPSKISSTTGYDFGETFKSRLIPVTWEDVDASKYAADKTGTTFTVTGTAEYKGKTHQATAEISVKNPVIVAESNSSVTFENIQLDDIFWTPRQATNATTSLNKAISEIAKSSGGEPNFDNAIKKLNGEEYGEFSGLVFQDSDIYKSIEAISYTLSATQNDTSAEAVAQRKKLQDKVDSWIEKIEQVQYADGYIDTYFTLRGSADGGGPTPITHRWEDLSRHEMYNAGHLLEGVVAYTRYREGINDPDYRLYVAGKRFADEIVSLFGPGGTRHEVPGHEEIELGLVKLGKLAEEYEGQGAGQKYYDTAKVLIDRRGEDENLRDSGYKGYTYSQDQTPFKQETNAVGHAVRANYFYTGVTDIATMLPEDNADRAAYLNSLDAIWDSVTTKKTYITGGIGATTATSDAEGFGADYDLPPDQSYIEICAAIAAANWNQRMNLLHEDGKYADMVEKNLYNSILVGENLDGNLFYYSSLLRVDGGNPRSNWFFCACCPPNLMRTIASLSGYMYTVHKDDVFVNMFVGSDGKINVGGTQVGLKQETEYPWDGAVKMTVSPQTDKEFAMKIRIPGWVNEQKNKDVTIKVNGQAVDTSVEKGYVTINRTWKSGDVVDIDIPMEIRMTESDKNVKATQGMIALQRGPIVYCMEKAGNAQLNEDIEDFDPLNFVIPRDADLKAEYNEELLNGVVEITGNVKYATGNGLEMVDAKLQAIPYYAWNNRGDDAEYVPGTAKNNSSKMLIWTMADKPPVRDSALVDFATPSVAFAYQTSQNAEKFADNNDGTFWNGWGDSNLANRDQWMMYDFGGRKADITASSIWFFDDNGGVVTPTSIKIEYEKGDGTWAEVTPVGTWTYAKNTYNTYEFEKVTTSKIRVTMNHATSSNGKLPVAVVEWKLTGDMAATNAEKEALLAGIESVKATVSGLNKDDYTEESWNRLQAAIQTAEDVAAKQDANLLTDIKAAEKGLSEALDGLEIKTGDDTPKVNKEALNASITAAKEKKQADYTSASWNVLQTALTAAQTAADNPDATQDEVNRARDELDAAVNALVPVEVKTEDKTENKTEVVIATKNLTLGVKESYSVKSSNCTYTTSDDKTASVSKTGQIKAKKIGSVTIQVIDKDGNITKYNVTVKKAPDKKAKVTLNKKKVTLSVKNKKKKTFTIKAKVSSKKYGCATFKYTIDKAGKKAIKVDKTGKVTAKKKGKAVITVKPYNGKGKSAKLTVAVK